MITSKLHKLDKILEDLQIECWGCDLKCSKCTTRSDALVKILKLIDDKKGKK